MDEGFRLHLLACEKCRRFDPKKMATLVFLWLEGSRLFKDQAAAEAPRKERAPRDPNYASPREIARVTRYK